MLSEISDLKLAAAVIGAALGIISCLPYIWQIFKRKTKPHAFTWLIWFITLSTAAAGVWYGGGGPVAIGIITNVVFVFAIFLLSLKYGSRNITGSDVLVLVIAIAAIFVWWTLENPILALLMATSIDLMGYIPTYRKTYEEPHTENLLAWIGFILAPALGLYALMEYNWLTVTYLAATLIANVFLVLLILLRRRALAKT